MVFSCREADIPSVSDFVPNPMNLVGIYGRNSLLSVPAILPNLREEVEQKLCLYSKPTQKRPGV